MLIEEFKQWFIKMENAHFNAVYASSLLCV